MVRTHEGPILKTCRSLLVLAVSSALLLTGCSASDGIDDLDRPELEPVEEVPEPPAEVAQPPVEPPAPAQWDCYWDPTMNDDWHDDYACTNGSAVDRPYLIPDDSFVERWEIDEAAAAYEAQLNS